ncbi:AcrR family transcriptional regulator [Mycolicibacterium iranicum]|uniref:AcrR family transcriptional regulator n=1 Tax=Mycolicibacterium iranicum TaxID=912594 RepID=A0A839Q085_MYCIR|nr:TetR/AcrR family transcriptional regulator [Mycolicibacterium iranicum]MBB2989169.1 AcrR family transcriptional regulator [Mycolicibacterium iranicum]
MVRTERDRRRRLPAAERRRQIIAETTALIAERGFWGLSTQDVADACGITVPGLLHHVGSKEALLLEVLTHRDEEDARALAEDLAGQPRRTGVPLLRQMCSAIVRRNAAAPEVVRLFTVLQGESLTPTHPAHAYFQRRRRRAVAALADLASGHADDPEALARRLLAMMDGLQIQWLQEPDRVDLVSAWEDAAGGLFGRRARRSV